MNRHVSAIAGRLSLRPPQRQSLQILDRITEIATPKKGADVAAAMAAIQSGFPSLCFALATGVGKTRLVGASIAYLHLAHSIVRAATEPHDLRQADHDAIAENIGLEGLVAVASRGIE